MPMRKIYYYYCYLVYHTRRDMLLYLPKSAHPGLFYPWNSHVCGPAPSSISGSSLRGVVTRFFVYSLIATAFWARRFQHKARHLSPRAAVLFGKYATGSHRTGRPAQGFSLTKLVTTTTTSISSSAPAHPLKFRLSSLVLAWLLLAAPSARCS